MLVSGQRKIRLERRNFAANDTPSLTLKNLPSANRLIGFELNLDLTITQNGAAALITGDKLIQLFSQVKVGKRFDTTGQCVRILDAVEAGGEFSLPADVPATNAGVFKRNVRLFVAYAGDESKSPGDTAPRVEVLRDLTLDLKMGDTASLYPTFASVTGTLRAWAIVETERGRHVAAPFQVRHQDFSTQSIVLTKGGIAYEHLFLFKENGASFTSAEVTSIQVKVDGETIVDDMDLGEVAAQWNRLRALGSTFRTTSATAPVGLTALNDQKDPANGGTGLFTLPFIPIIINYKGISKRRTHRVQSGVEITLQGSLTSFRVGSKAVEMQSGDQVKRAAIKTGLGAPANFHSTDAALESDPQAASLGGKTV